MIPKRIFYVWFGPMQDSVQQCIKSWKSVMPDWDIQKVDDSSPWFNFQNELKCKWFKTIYQKKIWAYVSDYIRIKTLLDHGGFYCDTDITTLQSFEALRTNEFFAGFESDQNINLAIFGCIPKHKLLEDIYNFYQNKIWTSPLYTIPQITTHILINKYGLILHDSRKDQKIIKIGTITLYPEIMFYPYRYDETFDDKCIKKETYTIHWWKNSWGKQEIYQWLDTKHCINTEIYKGIKKNNLENSLKLEIKILFFKINCFKYGRFYVFKFLKLPIFAIKYTEQKIEYLLFARFCILSREIKCLKSL